MNDVFVAIVGEVELCTDACWTERADNEDVGATMAGISEACHGYHMLAGPDRSSDKPTKH